MSEHDDKLKIRQLERTIVWLIGLLQQAWEALEEEEGEDLPARSEIYFKTQRGQTMNPVVLLTDPPGKAVYQEFNAAGSPVPPVGSVAYSSDTPSVATVDPVSGQLAYVGAGSANISASDGGNLPAMFALTVSAATTNPNAPVSSTLTFVPGVSASPAVSK